MDTGWELKEGEERMEEGWRGKGGGRDGGDMETTLKGMGGHEWDMEGHGGTWREHGGDMEGMWRGHDGEMEGHEGTWGDTGAPSSLTISSVRPEGDEDLKPLVGVLDGGQGQEGAGRLSEIGEQALCRIGG